MPTVKQTARELLRANRKYGVSWRTISKNGYTNEGVIICPGLNHATINKFAMRKGQWIPSDIEKQKMLGIFIDKQPKPKSIFEMSSDELLKVLKNRQPMTAVFSQREMNDYVRECKQASKARKATA